MMKSTEVRGKKINLVRQQYQNIFRKSFLYIFLAGKCVFRPWIFCFIARKTFIRESVFTSKTEERIFEQWHVNNPTWRNISSQNNNKDQKRETNNEKRRKAHPLGYNMKQELWISDFNWNVFKIEKG